jgi:hypothetical protein
MGATPVECGAYSLGSLFPCLCKAFQQHTSAARRYLLINKKTQANPRAHFLFIPPSAIQRDREALHQSF